MVNIATMLALMGQQGAPRIGPPGYGDQLGQNPEPGVPLSTDTVGTDEIVSTGRRQPMTADNPLYSLLPRDEDPTQIRQAAADTSTMPRSEASPQELAGREAYKNLPQHKGMFGVKGTLRDVLGTLGDALLVGSGKNPIYSQQRSQEQLADRMVGFGQGNPETDAAVIQRVAPVDPDRAMKMATQLQQQKLAQSKLTSQDARAANAQRIQKAKLMPNLLAAAKDNPDQQEALKAWYQDPNSSIQDLDPDTLAKAAVTQYQQQMLGQGDRRLKETSQHNRATESIGQQNAKAHMISATKPRAGSRGPAPTDASMAAPLLAKIRAGQPLTDGEKEVLMRVGHGTNRGRAESVRDRLGKPQGTPATDKAPPVGYKNKYGLTFNGGDPSDRKNWK